MNNIEKTTRYLWQLFSLQAQARRMKNERVAIALQYLINKIVLRGLRVN